MLNLSLFRLEGGLQYQQTSNKMCCKLNMWSIFPPIISSKLVSNSCKKTKKLCLQDILLSKFSICSHAMQAFMDLATQKTTIHPSWTVKPSRSRFLFDTTLERWILTLDIKHVFICIFCGWYIEMVKFMFQKSDIYRKSWNWGKFWPLQMYRWKKMLWCCETWSTDKIVFVSLEH